MSDVWQQKGSTRLMPALAVGTAAASAAFLGAEFGPPHLDLAATFLVTVGVSLLISHLARSGRQTLECMAIQNEAGRLPIEINHQSPEGGNPQSSLATDTVVPNEIKCKNCAEQLPAFDRLLERSLVSNTSVVNETENAVVIIMTQLRAIETSLNSLLQYMRNSYNSVQQVVANVQTEIKDNRNLIIKFIESRNGDIVKTQTRFSKIDAMATELAATTNSIRTIARQSNMLALNATIEASQAGEFGAGFSVVASEVKTLAKQSDKAAQEIGAGLERLRSVIRDSIVLEVENRINKEKIELDRVSSSIGDLTSQTEKLIAFELELLDRVQSESERISDAVVQLMGSIQFQDVIRQRLEHLSNISEFARVQLREVSEVMLSGRIENLPSPKKLATAVEEDGPCLPRSQMNAELIELF